MATFSQTETILVEIGVISAEVADVLTRLGSSVEVWQCRMQRLYAGRCLGRYFAGQRTRLRELAKRMGVHHLANLSGCPASG